MRVLQAQQGYLFPWASVCLAVGIGVYFSLPVEPSGRMLALLGLGAGLGGALAWRWPVQWAPLWLGMALMVAGVAVAGLRTQLVAAPVLEYRQYGPVSGRLVQVDRSISDAPRLTLDRVWIAGLAPEKTPARVRISAHGGHELPVLVPGTQVMMTAHLSPPNGPAEPGGFDFRRHAWYRQLGAVGYTRVPVMIWAPPGRDAAGLWVHRLRMRISHAIRAQLPGPRGAFAAAIVTGDRSAIDRAELDHLRQSNLAHLLAISGLHMGLLTGFIFAALRSGLALVPPLALRLPTKKLAAVVALLAGAGYLGLSGASVATQRAFVMVAVMLVAVLLDRRAVTLRAVGLAALLILILRPESLTEAGFQMSFAATTALVVVFSLLRRSNGAPHALPRWARAALGLVMSSAIAGAATAPLSAAHFNQVAQYGLLANTLSVPLMGLVVMPAAVLAALLAPLGLEALGLTLMGWGIEWILGVARWVSGLEGAVWAVKQPQAGVLPLLGLGGLWLALWRGMGRLGGGLPVICALGLWIQTERPALLISQSGGLMGVLGPQGRVLSKPKGEGFVARSWLENDGDRVLPPQSYARPGPVRAAGVMQVDLAGVRFTHVSGRGWQEKVADCGSGYLVIARRIEGAAGGCQLIDQHALARSGAVAVYRKADGVRIVNANMLSGVRPWSRRP